MIEQPRPPRPSRRPVPVSRELWWHCAESCLAVVLAVVLAAWLLPGTVPSWEPSGLLAVVTCVAAGVTLRVTGSGALAAWVLAWGVALTGWFTAARIAGAWSADVLGALVLAVAVLTPLGPPLIGSYRVMSERDADAEDRARQLAELRKWEKTFADLGAKNVRVTAVHRHGNGIEVHGHLGSAGDGQSVITFEQLKTIAPLLVTHFNLAGDAASFEQPDRDNAARFTLSLRTRKGRRATAFLPESTAHTSVNKPLELGLHDNGRPFRLLLRHIAVMVIGAIDAGKSNVLGVIIGQLARCEDVLIFCIDLKGGLMARPWMQAWVDDPDGVRRPVIDWVATTRAEAYLMLETLIAAGDARANSGAIGEKVTPRRDLPQVVLIMDETAVATGHDRKDEDISSRKLAVLLARLVETYRALAIVPVVAAVRGDVETMGLSAVKAQSLARIGLKVSQAADGDSVFPDNHEHAKLLAKITDPGAGLVLLKGKMSAPVHFYRVTPKIAYYRAAAFGQHRPAPDPVLERGLGQAYAERWDRAAEMLQTWRTTSAAWKAEAEISAAVPAGRAAAGGGDGPVPRPGGLPPPPPDGDDPEAYIDSVLREVIAQAVDPDETEPGKAAARRRVRELLMQAGPAGMKVSAIVKQLAAEAQAAGSPELAVHRNTVHEWLKKDEELGRVRRRGHAPGDPHARWSWIRQDRGLRPDIRPGDDAEEGYGDDLDY